MVMAQALMTTKSILPDSTALQEEQLAARINGPSPPSDRADGVSLKNAIHDHLLNLGFSKNGSGYFVDGVLTKQKIRNLHAAQRLDILEGQRRFVETYGSELAKHFASGSQIDPGSIDPKLVEVSPGSLESRLFRFASLLWSVPVSQGFGRRLRFLVKDRQNDCLIGLFALGDPVFNLSARDNWIGWTHEDRRDRLVHVMDAYVVGAVPPYSQLIGGKLVAALMGSKEVRRAYERKYLARESVIRQRKNRARLVLLTTTSRAGSFIHLQPSDHTGRPSLPQNWHDQGFRPLSPLRRGVRFAKESPRGGGASLCLRSQVRHGAELEAEGRKGSA